jgi:hypothetical protein
MSSRSVRRRQHHRLERVQEIPLDERRSEAARLLLAWRQEARSRACRLDAPAVWALAADPAIRGLAAALDPGGELQADLNRICAEAIAAAAGPSLVRGSRPLADRGRLTRSSAPLVRVSTRKPPIHPNPGSGQSLAIDYHLNSA